MKIAYYLNEGRKKNLYCRISDGKEKTTFSLGHYIIPKEWNAKKEESSGDDPYFFTLMNFKKYLGKRYHELKSEGRANVLAILKNEATTFIDGSGIEGIARKMFDDRNEQHRIPPYNDFLEAFEKFSGLKKGAYKAKVIGEDIRFHTSGQEYEVSTYASLTAFLRSIIDDKSYEEIYAMTDEKIWGDIYIDAGIPKARFIPRMLREWEIYWEKTYNSEREEIGKTDHLDKMKEKSWRQFQVYSECYNDHGNSIELAYELNDMELYPIAVITMLQIFNPEHCYLEYNEFEFSNEEWEEIILTEDDESPVFYIKKAD